MNEHYKGLGHIAIYTKDLEESVRFYEKIGGMLCRRAVLEAEEGTKYLALVSFAGVTLELIQVRDPALGVEGTIPHFAIYVDDVAETAAGIKSAGVDTFMTPKKRVLPNVFGGAENWFFTGPSGEQIELLNMSDPL